MVGFYNPWLVFAIVASYVALDLIGGALSMGSGIWSMQFVGMLAFDLPIP